MSYDISWVPFRNRNNKKESKTRTIRYAARRDSFIFSFYRRKLEQLYELELAAAGLESNVLAYRRIPVSGKQRNKSNIQFARDAFAQIGSLAPCYALCLDIKGFFDSLDHKYLKRAWAGLLRKDRLPEDHFSVFKAVTSYAYVERVRVYEKLGIIGRKLNPSGSSSIGYLKKWKEIPTQLCDPETYRKDIKPLVRVNEDPFGIPQGIPMSDLLSNLYLLQFDKAAKGIIDAEGGQYFRYSDDILVLLPLSSDASKIKQSISAELSKTGPQMKLKAEKCSTHECSFEPSSRRLKISQIEPSSSANGLEYLGYRFDGNKIFIRSSTLSRLHRKITMSVRIHVKHLLSANPGATLSELTARLNDDLIHGRYGRRQKTKVDAKSAKVVAASAENRREPPKATFFSYAKRSQEEHDSLGSGSISQLKGLRRFIRWRAEKELDNAFRRTHKP